MRVPALQKALIILETLQKHRRCTISDLISYTDLPRSSVYVLVDDMIKLRLIRQNSDKSIQLWMKLVSLGNSASASLDLNELISPYLDRLISSIDCIAVNFGIMDDDKAYCSLNISSPNSSVRINSRVGAEVSLLHSALGKCLLAYSSSSRREQIINSLDYSRATANSIATPEALRKELAVIHNRGYAFDNGEENLDIRSVSAPILDFDNHLIGAISTIGTTRKFSKDALPSIIDKIKLVTMQIKSDLMI